MNVQVFRGLESSHRQVKVRKMKSRGNKLPGSLGVGRLDHSEGLTSNKVKYIVRV